MQGRKVLVVGAGIAGLASAYILQKAGFETQILEASHRVGGRVRTARECFANGLHGELGAMRLPESHELVNHYLDELGLKDQLEPFEQRNKLIYLTGLGRTITYPDFENLLRQKNPDLLRLFPTLYEREKGKTLDELWQEAIAPIEAFGRNERLHFIQAGRDLGLNEKEQNNFANTETRRAIRRQFYQYTLQSYLEEVAGWSPECVRLYEYCSAHVVLGNAISESIADSFLSSQKEGMAAGMRQLKGGMDRLAWAFLDQEKVSLAQRIRFGARVHRVKYHPRQRGNPAFIDVEFLAGDGNIEVEVADYIIFSVPFPAMSSIRVEPRFSLEKSRAINELRYVEVTKILAQFKTRWWERVLDEKYGQGSEGGLITDLPIRYLMFPHAKSSQFAARQTRGVVMASYVFERDAARLGVLNDAEKMQIVRENLGEIFGDDFIHDTLEVCVSQNWSNDFFSGGAAFSYFGPYQDTRLFPHIISTEWDGRACFAGEHASDWHGWIEGALVSAHRVAVQIKAHDSA